MEVKYYHPDIEVPAFLTEDPNYIPLQRNYKTPELAIEAVQKYYNPDFKRCINLRNNNCDLRQMETITVSEPHYKTYTTGSKKGQIKCNSKGEPIVSHTVNNKVQKLINDYSNYCITRDKLHGYKDNHFEHYSNYKGYYETVYKVRTEASHLCVTYIVNVYVKFITVKIHHKPEIKVEGQPYQPKSVHIEECGESELFKLRYKYNSYNGFHANEKQSYCISDTFLGEEVVLRHNVYISEHTLTIHDKV